MGLIKLLNSFQMIFLQYKNGQLKNNFEIEK